MTNGESESRLARAIASPGLAPPRGRVLRLPPTRETPRDQGRHRTPVGNRLEKRRKRISLGLAQVGFCDLIQLAVARFHLADRQSGFAPGIAHALLRSCCAL